MKIYTTEKYPKIKTIRIYSICFVFFFLLSNVLRSQDLYNLENSRNYADYLFSGRQYNLAAEEYERLIFFDGDNQEFRLKLIKSYRLSGNLNTGIRRTYTLYGDSLSFIPEQTASEFIRLQILSDSLSRAAELIELSNTLSLRTKSVFHSYNLLLTGDYKKASLFVHEAMSRNIEMPMDLLRMTDKAERMKLKSPLLAGSLSAVIPGSGKFYTKNWTDGFIALMFVATNAWQAYRGFNADGIKSGYGWVFTGLSTSFYIGNIFGSAKAAKRYNRNRKDEINNQIYEVLKSDSF